MRLFLNEEINYKVERASNGTPVAYIDPKTSENTFKHKDIFKKHGAKWDGYAKRWYWWLSNDSNKTDEIIKTQINPAIDELTSVETVNGSTRRNPEDVKGLVAKMVKELDIILAAPSGDDSGSTKKSDEIKRKVETFKEKIVNITNSDEFKALVGPIIKFRQAMGHQYSFGNTILIWVQDPKATMVKSKSRWKLVNRYVVDGAPAIFLYNPKEMTPYTEEEKKVIIKDYLIKCGVKKYSELNPGQKDSLKVKLNGKKPKYYALEPVFYDHRFTRVIDGKEDLAPSASTEDIEWFDDKTPSSEKTVALYDAAIISIKETGIQLSFTDDLDGARGVSKNGHIEVLKDSKKNIGDFNTLVHEFSHELLHQRYLKGKDKGSYGSFFIGTSQGRAMVEQQAELSAWIICQYFGYEMPTSINYMGCWGMDAKNAANVFDTVANTSTYIIELISKNMKSNIKESIDGNEPIITGEYIAKLVGLDNLYKKSKEMQDGKFNENKLREMVREALEGFRRGYFDDDDFGSEECYTHFAVNKNTGLIVNGWDYSGYDSDELRQFKKDYFIQDLIDNDFNPKEYKILTKQGCLKQGINPDDMQNYWSNRGDIPLKDEQR